MSSICDSICVCGKKRKSLNLTNWNRHLNSCSVAKLKTKKICSDLSSYLLKKDKNKSLNTNSFKKSLYYFN